MFKRISAIEAKKLLQEKMITIFDIRDETSYQTDHIENAIWLNQTNFANYVEILAKDTPIILYCYRGYNSQLAANTLIEFGFTEVYSLDGGFNNFNN